MTAAAAEHPWSEWRRHWPTLLASMAGIAISTVHGYSLGVMIGPLEKEYGWSRAEISSGPLIMAIMALFVAPVIGAAVDRVGARRIALFGVTFFCGALALLSTATASIASWLGLWVVMSVGAMFVLPTIWTAAVNSFFTRNRGLALAVALCGSGLGGAIIPSLTNGLVDSYGWRGGYVALAIISAVVVLPTVFFGFSSAYDRRRAEGGTAKVVLPGTQIRAAIGSARFLKLGGGAVLVSCALCSISANAVPILVSQQFSRTGAAGIAGLIGLGAIAGRLGGGWLLDRLDANKVAAASVLAPVASALLLLFMPGSSAGATAAFVILGLAAGTELDACAYLAARHFGMRNFGTLFGIINGFLIFGNGLAPLVANHVFDVTHAYDLVLWAAIPLSLVSTLLFLTLGPYPAFEEASPPHSV